MQIRRLDIGDTEAFWNLQKQLDQETKFMMLEPDERKYEIGKAVGNIARMDFAYTAVENGKLVGFLSAVCGGYRRIRKTAYIVVGILQDYQHQGIGHELFLELNQWAIEKEVQRLELTVRTDNTRAIALYRKNGFEIEGLRRRSMFIDGEFVDEFYMSKIFDDMDEGENHDFTR
ncbi:GNAT family N-acetyltransferase [Lactococcus fujiensis]|uniref:Acetyltransferase n=1 Tax=Lactococcus fujiensis JCM 16395 TaxID=1291764 RepID=A0A2A5RJX6_9LACT|nr:GNAT family N-acetyltransferase [Lactococcus fujiensis]PCR99508.1 acetyltransferase [Lactococcus fujiensis JCM 16395]